MTQVPFWEKPLQSLTSQEWEALCDGCGKCCLHKLIDDETEELHYTNVRCQQLNHETAQCQDYANRMTKVPSCLKVTPSNIPTLDWLPNSCSYRLRFLQQPLPQWHPLLVGYRSVMHTQGASVVGKVISETHICDDLEDYIVRWPLA